MLFNGSAGNEMFEASANGGRLRFTRNLGNIVMDIDDVEIVDLNDAGRHGRGHRRTTCPGTDVTKVAPDLAGTIGGNAGDGLADTVIVNGTNGADLIDVVGAGTLGLGDRAARRR